jgi:histidyl-tRNA synthetase
MCPAVRLDVTLARGLNYYTGTILEVKPLNIQMGSIGGGGRYDDLTGLFGVPNIPGVGISFGVDRIYDVMEEKNLFPEAITGASLKVMLVNFGAEFDARNLEILRFLRGRQISCELYPEAVKFEKQLKYANRRGVEFIILVGESELAEERISIKNFSSGEQSSLSLEEALHMLK